MWCLRFGSYATEELQRSQLVTTDIKPIMSQRRGTKRRTLMNTLEDIMNKEDLIDIEQISNNKFANVHQIVTDSEDGLNTRLQEDETRVSALIDENKTIMQGTGHRKRFNC